VVNLLEHGLGHRRHLHLHLHHQLDLAVSSVTMTVPTATGGAPASDRDPSNSSGTVGLRAVLTYSRSSTSLNSAPPSRSRSPDHQHATAGNYTSTVTTKNGNVVDSG